MRIESLGSTNANLTSPSPPAVAAPAAAASAKTSASTTTVVDPATGQPVPPKFPWITRLTLELEKNAQKTSPFVPAKIVGETIDKLV